MTALKATERTNELDVLLAVGLVTELLQADVALKVLDTIVLVVVHDWSKVYHEMRV